MDERIRHFVETARRGLTGLRHEPSDEVAHWVADALAEVDRRLGIEIGDDAPERREMIFTAFAAAGAFPLVRRIVAALEGAKIAGWQFIALKPPRGFDFTLGVGEQRLHAQSIRFAAIPDIENGIQVIVDPHVLEVLADDPDGAEELAWLVVETGIGEELASRLRQIEFVDTRCPEPSRPIGELGRYVATLPEWE